MTISIALRDEKGALIELDDLKNLLVLKRKSNDLTEYVIYFFCYKLQDKKLIFPINYYKFNLED